MCSSVDYWKYYNKDHVRLFYCIHPSVLYRAVRALPMSARAANTVWRTRHGRICCHESDLWATWGGWKLIPYDIWQSCHISEARGLSHCKTNSLHIYIYIYMHVCMYVCMHLAIIAYYYVFVAFSCCIFNTVCSFFRRKKGKVWNIVDYSEWVCCGWQLMHNESKR